MYSSLPTFVIGFHGCDKEVQQKVLLGKATLTSSENDYDWLGDGIYFWENNPTRALDFAKEVKNNPRRYSVNIKIPAVIGAIIDLGNCFNLVDSRYIELLREGYTLLTKTAEKAGFNLPQNTIRDDSGNTLKRNLDCAVIRTIHTSREAGGKEPFDTVRGVFIEGKELYENAGFNTKTHIQLCVRNVNCIKGFFLPREPDLNLPIP